MPVKFRDFPIDKVAKQATERMQQTAAKGILMSVHQKWTCKHCGSRQTMDQKNVFFRSGICEECKQTSLINRCNYVAMLGGAANMELPDDNDPTQAA